MAVESFKMCLGGCVGNNNLQNIFQDEACAEIFKELIGIDVCEGNSLCKKCKDILLTFHEFKKRCLDFFTNKIIEISEDYEEIIEEEMEIKQEHITDSDFMVIVEPSEDYVQPPEIFVEEFDEQEDFLDQEMKSEIQEIDEATEASVEVLDDNLPETASMNENTCNFCGKNYKSKTLLQRHQGKRHKEAIKKIRQTECNKKMTEWRKSRVSDKISIFDAISSKQCLYCFQEFKGVKDLVQHKLIHITEVKPYHCPLIKICTETFSSRRAAEFHYVEHKINETKEIQEDMLEKAMEVPPVEPEEFTEPTPDEIVDSVEIRQMAKKVFASKKFFDVYKDFNYKLSCEYCFQDFESQNERADHALTHTTEDMPYKCPFEGCTESFRRREYLRHHHFKHTNVEKFVCIHENCDKTFYGKLNLKTHLETHTLIRRYMCTTCGHQSISQQNLRLHMRTHTNERPYKCDICEKAFKTRYPYTTHMRTHDNDKRFVCDYCPVRFVTNSKKKLHERGHRGEKPYACNLCEHKYTTKRHLRIHYRNVHELEIDMKQIPNYNNFKLSKVNNC